MDVSGPFKLPKLVPMLLLAGAAALAQPTFNKEVVRIFQANCQTCHHPGDVSPFSMMDYASTRPWARSIRDQVLTRKMPPWKPTQGAETFRNSRIMSQQDIDTIVAWVDAGSPEGDPADLPAPLTFNGGWSLGEPDLVLKPAAAFSVPGSGNDIYRCFSIPTGLNANQYISAFQVRPADRSVVHHVIIFSDPAGTSQGLEAKAGGNGYPCFGDPGFTPDPSFLAGWAPGIGASSMNPGTAMSLAKGGFLTMQVHYHLNGTATQDQTQVGLYFSTTPVDKIVTSIPLVNTSFTIPAGNAHYPVTGGLTVPLNLHIVNVLPHMHLLGRESHVTLTNGKTTTSLIDINDWDFNWQGSYDYVTPVAAPPLSRVSFTKYFDNSVNNPRNPNSPPIAVSWGEQTTDEMAVVFFGITLDAQHLISPAFAGPNVVNAASFASGTAAPGSIMTLFGVGLGSNWVVSNGGPSNTLAGSKITIGGVTAPLFYASPSQVSFQVPYEATGPTKLAFTREDGVVTSVDLTVGEAQPGLFTLNAGGTGPAAATLANNSVITSSNPATRGSTVVLYATGLGRVSPSVATGVGSTGIASAVNKVQVTIGGRTVDPDYAGLTPGYPGLYQINFRVPADLAATGDVAVKVSAAGVDSNPVTIAVK
jgi:uncharacterized protein (TIGR03437 family)